MPLTIFNCFVTNAPVKASYHFFKRRKCSVEPAAAVNAESIKIDANSIFSMKEQDQRSYDQVFHSHVTRLPQIKAVDTLYYAAEDIILYENEQTSPFNRKDDLVMVFNFKGDFSSYFGGLSQPFTYTPQCWSFSYAPQDNVHPAPAGQWMETLAFGINKTFFTELIAHEEDPWLERMLNNIEQSKPLSLVPDNTRISPRVMQLLQQFRNSPVTGSLKSLYQQSRVFEILTNQLFYLKAMETPATANAKISRHDYDKLHELKRYLEHNFLKELTLDGLARLSGLNTFKLKTGFRQLFAVSVFEMIRTLRMQYAQAQLKDNALTVGQVAHQLGYEHVQHFSAAYKKHHGYSPKYSKTLQQHLLL
jgi:AraC-like DNA-binding protein